MIECPVQPRNPAEVLAACGLFNLASRQGPVQGQFTLDQTFRLDTEATLDELLAPLDRHQVAVADDCSWVTLSEIRLDWWIREGKDFKLWAGQVNADNLVKELLRACEALRTHVHEGNLLALSIPLTKRFGADPRSSWVSLDIGFSPNDQGQGAVHTRPFTELLAMIGLQTFLPRQQEAFYGYSIWQTMLPLLPARLAFSGTRLPVPVTRYRFAKKKSGSFSVFEYAQLEE